MSNKKEFIKNTVKLAFSIFINKPLGLLRDVLRVRYFGIGLLGDAFSMAWRLPNMFRRMFGEGAMTAALVPTLVQIKEKYGEKELNALSSFIFLVMQIFIFFFCFFMALKAKTILNLIAPGAVERVVTAIPMFEILIFFTLFMSSSVILGCNLQTIGIFSVGPMSQFFLNIALCLEFGIGILLKLSAKSVCLMILFNGLIIFFIHYFVYKKNGFYFSKPTKNTFIFFKDFFYKVIPAFISSGISDVNLLIDQAIASYLPTGSQSMLDCITGFIRIPLHTVGSAFATVSAPQFAKVALKKSTRLSFYVYEAAKIMFFVSFVSFLFFYFFSYKLLYTILLSDKFSIKNVEQGAILLSVFSPIIFFSSFCKILLNVFYSHHKVAFATTITIFSSFLNTILNLILMKFLGLTGIVLATVIAEAVRVKILLIYMKKYFKISFPYKRFFNFCKNLIFQISIFSILFYFSILMIQSVFIKIGPNFFESYTNTWRYWLWMIPLILVFGFFILKSRKKFGIKIYYLKNF